MCWLFSNNHLSEVLGLKGTSEDHDVGNFDAYVADDGGDGHWELLDVTGPLDSGHCTAIRVDFVQVREECLNSGLSLANLL